MEATPVGVLICSFEVAPPALKAASPRYWAVMVKVVALPSR